MHKHDGNTAGEPAPAEDSVLSQYNNNDQSTIMDLLKAERVQNAQTFHRELGTKAITFFMMVLGDMWLWFFLTWQYALSNGGGTGAVIVFACSTPGFVCILCNAIYQAARFPNIAGPAYWTYILWHPKSARKASFANAWCLAIGWSLGAAGTNNYVATLLVGAWSSLHAKYEWQAWHVVGASCAICVFAILVNLFMKWLRYASLVAAACSFLAFIIVLVSISIGWAFFTPTPHDINSWGWANANNWSTLSLALLANFNAPATTFIGVDAATHMTLETKNPGRSIPRGMTWSALYGYLTVFAMCGLIVHAPYNREFAERCGSVPLAIFHRTTGEHILFTLFVLALVLAALVINTVNQMLTSTRMLWAFSDGLSAVPFFTWLTKVNTKTGTPLRITAIQAVLTLTLAFVNLSPVGVLTVPAASISFLALGYSINFYALGRHILACNGKLDPPCEWRPEKVTGTMPPVTNTIWIRFTAPLGFVFAIFLVVVLQFPQTPNPTPALMNWSLVMVVLLGLLGVVVWLFFVHPRGSTKPPLWTITDYESTALLATQGEMARQDDFEPSGPTASIPLTDRGV